MPLNFQQSGSPTGGRILTIVLLVVSLVLTTVYAREGEEGPLHALQGGMTVITTPAQYLGSGVGAGVETMENSISDATADESTLTGLREQNQELREMLANAEEYRLEAERLEALLNMKTSSGVEGIGARVIGRSTDAWNQSITINVGSDDGVTTGMTVMGSSGVVGQVVQVNPTVSTVRLLTDPNSGAAVMVQSSRAEGVVRGSLSGLLYLEDIDEDSIPSVGDVIITSGLGGSYTAGLMVGTVVSVNKTASNATGTIIVSPNDDISTLEEVIVVTGTSSTSTSTTSDSTTSTSSTTSAG